MVIKKELNEYPELFYIMTQFIIIYTHLKSNTRAFRLFSVK